MKKILLLNMMFYFALTNLSFAQSDYDSFNVINSRNKYHLFTYFINESSTLNTIASDTSVEKDSSFTIFSQTVGAEYFLNDSWSIKPSFTFALFSNIDTVAQGFDFGVTYYPLATGASKEVYFHSNLLTTNPRWSPFITLSASSRNYQFATISLQFQGLALGVGTNWHLRKEFYLQINFSYNKYFNDNSRKLTSSGLSLGIGKTF